MESLKHNLSSALETAISIRPDIIPHLLAAGAKISSSEFIHACECENYELASRYITLGVEPADNDEYNYQIALEYTYNHSEIVSLYEKVGATLGTTPLLYNACQECNISEIERLLHMKIDNHFLAGEALTHALTDGHLNVAELLVKKGIKLIDVDAVLEQVLEDEDTLHPIVKHEVVTYLKGLGAETGVLPPPPVLPIPHELLQMNQADEVCPRENIWTSLPNVIKGSLDDLKAWLEKAGESRLNAAFQVACKEGRLDCVNFLLEKGADPNMDACDSMRTNPEYVCFVIAVRYKRYEVVRRLIEAKANIDCHRNKPIRTAIGMRDERMVSILIEAGAKLTKAVKDDLAAHFPAIYAEWQKNTDKKNKTP